MANHIDNGYYRDGVKSYMTTDNVSSLESVDAAPQEQQNLLSQDKVNELIGREKARVRQEMMAQHQAELDKMRTGQTQSTGGMQDIDGIYNQIRERFMADHERQEDQRRQEEQRRYAEQIAQDYFGKMSKGGELYEDFEKITSQVDMNAFPQLVFLLSQTDAAPEIMYELANNKSKLAYIDYLANKSPMTAKAELDRLAESIRSNDNARQSHVSAPAPLNRLQPSVKAGADAGTMTLKDLKKAPWLRG